MPKIGVAAPFRGHTEWSTRLLELKSEPKGASRRHDSNTSKIISFRLRMREILLKPCRGCWLNPRWTWRPSWSRLVTWRWSRFVHVQRGDVLINADYSVWDSHFRRPFTRISNLFKRKESKSSSCESPHHFGPKGSISSLAKQSAFIPTFLKEEAGKLKRHQIDEWIHFLRLMNEYTSCFRFTD